MSFGIQDKRFSCLADAHLFYEIVEYERIDGRTNDPFRTVSLPCDRDDKVRGLSISEKNVADEIAMSQRFLKPGRLIVEFSGQFIRTVIGDMNTRFIEKPEVEKSL